MSAGAGGAGQRTPKAEALHQQALTMLAGAQDGAIGAGFPIAFDSTRQRWGALSPATSAYVACAFARCRTAPPEWHDRRYQLVRLLAGVQRHDGLIQATTLAEPRRNGSLTATGNAVIAWCHWQRTHPASVIQRAIERGAVALAERLADDPLRRCARDGVAVESFLPAAEAAYALALAASLVVRSEWRDIARFHVSAMLDECDDIRRGTPATRRLARSLLALLDGAWLCQTRDARTRIIAALRCTTARTGALGWRRRGLSLETRLALTALERTATARSLEVDALTPARADRIDRATTKRLTRRIDTPSPLWPCDTLADLMLASSPGL